MDNIDLFCIICKEIFSNQKAPFTFQPCNCNICSQCILIEKSCPNCKNTQFSHPNPIILKFVSQQQQQQQQISSSNTTNSNNVNKINNEDENLCKIHSKKPYISKCCRENVPVCVDCIVYLHNGHTLSDISSKEFEEVLVPDFKKMIDQTEDVKSIINSKIQESKENLSLNNEKLESTLALVTDTFEKIHEELKYRSLDLQTLIKKHFNHQEFYIKASIDSFNDKIKTLDETIGYNISKNQFSFNNLQPTQIENLVKNNKFGLLYQLDHCKKSLESIPELHKFEDIVITNFDVTLEGELLLYYLDISPCDLKVGKKYQENLFCVSTAGDDQSSLIYAVMSDGNSIWWCKIDFYQNKETMVHKTNIIPLALVKRKNDTLLFALDKSVNQLSYISFDNTGLTNPVSNFPVIEFDSTSNSLFADHDIITDTTYIIKNIDHISKNGHGFIIYQMYSSNKVFETKVSKYGKCIGCSIIKGKLIILTTKVILSYGNNQVEKLYGAPSTKFRSDSILIRNKDKEILILEYTVNHNYNLYSYNFTSHIPLLYFFKENIETPFSKPPPKYLKQSVSVYARDYGIGLMN
eukprot:gene11937-14610_t